MFYALYPTSSHAQSLVQAQNPNAERGSGVGLPRKGISSLVAIKEEEIGQKMRKRPQKPHQLSAQITSALWFRPDD